MRSSDVVYVIRVLDPTAAAAAATAAANVTVLWISCSNSSQRWSLGVSVDPLAARFESICSFALLLLRKLYATLTSCSLVTPPHARTPNQPHTRTHAHFRRLQARAAGHRKTPIHKQFYRSSIQSSASFYWLTVNYRSPKLRQSAQYVQVDCKSKQNLLAITPSPCCSV